MTPKIMPIKKKAMMIKTMSTPKKSAGQGLGGHIEDEDEDEEVDDEQLQLQMTIETWLTSAGFPEALVGETKSVSSLAVLGY